MCVILQDCCWIVHILFVLMVNFLHNSQWITLPTQSCLALYSFCASLLHSLIMWLIVSSLSPYNLHLLLCCASSILALIRLGLMTLLCSAISSDSVSLLKLPFLADVNVFSYEMSLVSRSKCPYIFSSHFCVVVVLFLYFILFFIFLIVSFSHQFWCVVSFTI